MERVLRASYSLRVFAAIFQINHEDHEGGTTFTKMNFKIVSFVKTVVLIVVKTTKVQGHEGSRGIIV